MTREAQIRQTASEWLRYNHPTCTQDMLVEAFRCGAEWADEHPKSPWIDINVELPEVKKRVIFLCNDKKAYFGYNNIDCESATITNAPDGVKITHWMPIPELPKKED